MIFNKFIFLQSIVPWATGTDEQITRIIQALDDGTLTFAQTGWAIGDTRVVQLSATVADSERGIEAHISQTAELVLMDTTCTGFTINGNKPHAIIGLKDGLLESGQMNTNNINNNGWRDCKRRSWCNTEFRNSLPNTVKSWFKQFEWKQGSGGGASSGLHITQDYFGLTPGKCVFGNITCSFNDEASSYNQWDYYKIVSNRIKKQGPLGTACDWWECSSTPSDFYCFCNVDQDGSEHSHLGAQSTLLLAPFGCI